MKELLLVGFNNNDKSFFNIKFKDCTKAEAVKQFKEEYDGCDPIVNIIEL